MKKFEINYGTVHKSGGYQKRVIESTDAKTAFINAPFIEGMQPIVSMEIGGRNHYGFISKNECKKFKS